jgi:serine/threonine protein kinase
MSNQVRLSGIGEFLKELNNTTLDEFNIILTSQSPKECSDIWVYLERIGSGYQATVYGDKRDKKFVYKVAHNSSPSHCAYTRINNRKNLMCVDLITMEFIIGSILTPLNLAIFPKYYEVFQCNDKTFAVMERINGHSFRDFIKLHPEYNREFNPASSEPFQVNFCFKALYSLMIANEDVGFCHNDLTLDNVMVIRNHNVNGEKFEINGVTYGLPPCDWDFRIIDYGNSFAEVDGVKIFSTGTYHKYYEAHMPTVPIHSSGDPCRILKNNSFRPHSLDNFAKNYINSCNYWRGITVVPPFPVWTIRDLFIDGMFSQLIEKVAL